ncbi:FAD-dependent oxidoreductase [Streptomyces sp. NK08204]|uniref:FAD-dependent oxidoreductase n=1 Tax=Streptomyces sp. NK08204 TaxID=2873260 RepID=UPI001CEC5031|nr:FAD-dependent oxidoreductase [Streptomyces sp. NK08204]
MTERTEALVIGAGVAGLTTAVCLAEQGRAVRVLAERPPRETTSAVAGAIIGGPLVSDEAEATAKFSPVDVTGAWQRASLTEFTALADRPGTGVHTARGRLVNQNADGGRQLAESLPGFEVCDEKESAGFAVACWATMPIIDMPVYLDHLAERVRAAGGSVETGTVTSLAEAAAQAPLVVNCAGVGARALAEDPTVVPVRGQHVIVENPGVEEFFYEQNAGGKATSFFPHGSRLVLGGTATREDWSLEPDPAQTQEILSRCIAVEPRIEGARITGVEVGLRASRKQLRLEAETVGGSRIIHNYGHGGIAVGLSWGCARVVLDLAAG